MLKNNLMVFFVSMVPVIELRGAIPIGLGMGLPALPTYLVCVLGNMLPVPFIYLFARKFLIWPLRSGSPSRTARSRSSWSPDRSPRRSQRRSSRHNCPRTNSAGH